MNNHLSMLTGAYAVDAVTGAEREEFERHLAGCTECTREVAEMRDTAALLGADTSVVPPDALKRRVLEEIVRTRQEPPEPQPRNVRALTPRTWGTRLAVAAAVLGIALAGAFGGIAWQSQRQLAEVSERIERAGDRGAEMAQVVQAPDARIVRSSTGAAEATTVVSRNMGKAMFLSSNLPSPPAEHVYQLWFIGKAGPSSAGLLTSQREGTSPVVATMPAGTGQMAVTVEPDGGSPQPTTDPVMLMNLPA